MIAYIAIDSKFGVIRAASQNLIGIIARSSDLRYNGAMPTLGSRTTRGFQAHFDPGRIQ